MPNEHYTDVESVNHDVKTVVRFTLDQMIRSVFGELNILAQRCLGDVGVGDQRSVILERYCLWRAHLSVAQEGLKILKAPGDVMQIMNDIFTTSESIQSAFKLLVSARSANAEQREQLCELFTKNYKQLSEYMNRIDKSLELGMEFFDRQKNLARVSGERSLGWLCRELRGARGIKGVETDQGLLTPLIDPATKWNFMEPPNEAVIADRKIIDGNDWIAYVSHDAADGGWQFHNSEMGPVTEADAAVVSLRNIVELDPSIIEIANLPRGWHAWRESRGASWRRAPTK
jgi:hypothetical protein